MRRVFCSFVYAHLDDLKFNQTDIISADESVVARHTAQAQR